MIHMQPSDPCPRVVRAALSNCNRAGADPQNAERIRKLRGGRAT